MISATTFTFSQSTMPVCGGVPSEESFSIPSLVYSKSIQPITTTSTEQYVFNLTFHIVRDSNGSMASNPVSEAQLQQVIFMLNTSYNQFNIFFKYIGFDYIDNSAFTSLEYGDTTSPNTSINLLNYAIANGKYNSESFNMFILPEILRFGAPNQVSGFADLPGVNSFIKTIYLNSIDVIPHEIGHNLNLLHTYHPFGPNSTITYCNSLVENITRDPLNANYNAASAGDFVTDTYPMIPFQPFPVQISLINCSYTNTNSATDCAGVVYPDNSMPVKNFMSTMLNFNCTLDYFTSGQGNRMRETIGYSETAGAGSDLNKIFLARTTIESLYELYKITQSGGTGSGGTTTASSRTTAPNETNTGLNIWNCPTYTFHYQKGFAYTFTDTNTGTQNHPTTATPAVSGAPFEILIPIVDATTRSQVAIECISTFEPYTTGTVISTYNLGSTQFSVKNLEEAEVTNPDFNETLQESQYHIINKQTGSGDTNQQIIYKN